MTNTLAKLRFDTDIAGMAAALLLGLGLLFAAGVSQATAAHDAAHDTRHALAFPCH